MPSRVEGNCTVIRRMRHRFRVSQAADISGHITQQAPAASFEDAVNILNSIGHVGTVCGCVVCAAWLCSGNLDDFRQFGAREDSHSILIPLILQSHEGMMNYSLIER